MKGKPNGSKATPLSQRSLQSFWQRTPTPASSGPASTPADILSTNPHTTPPSSVSESPKGTKRRLESAGASQQQSQQQECSTRDEWGSGHEQRAQQVAGSTREGYRQRTAPTPLQGPVFGTLETGGVRIHEPDAVKRRRTFQKLLGDGESKDAQAYR